MNTLVIILNWNIRFLRIFINRVLIHNLATKYIRLRLGQETGSAFTSVLFGDYNPSGKIPFTIAKDYLEYVPVIYNATSYNPQDDFTRSIFLD